MITSLFLLAFFVLVGYLAYYLDKKRYESGTNVIMVQPDILSDCEKEYIRTAYYYGKYESYDIAEFLGIPEHVVINFVTKENLITLRQ